MGEAYTGRRCTARRSCPRRSWSTAAAKCGASSRAGRRRSRRICRRSSRGSARGSRSEMHEQGRRHAGEASLVGASAIMPMSYHAAVRALALFAAGCATLHSAPAPPLFDEIELLGAADGAYAAVWLVSVDGAPRAELVRGAWGEPPRTAAALPDDV